MRQSSVVVTVVVVVVVVGRVVVVVGLVVVVGSVVVGTEVEATVVTVVADVVPVLGVLLSVPLLQAERDAMRSMSAMPNATGFFNIRSPSKSVMLFAFIIQNS